MRARRVVLAGLCVAATAGTTVLAPAASAASGPPVAARPDPGPGVVVEWSDIAFRTVATEAAKPIPVQGLYLGIVSVAVYQAVATASGRLTPYVHQPGRHRGTSARAAAVVAAHDVLVEYFPDSAPALDRDEVASLSRIREGARRSRGEAVGRRSADIIIGLRRHDGRDDPVAFVPPTGLGFWVAPPTGMLVPWLGYVRPLVLDSPREVPLSGPDPVGSAAYAADYREVQALGALTGSARTAEQTENALFWNANSVRQYQLGAMRVATRQRLGVAASARLFALLHAGGAEALISCWRAKQEFAFWRPSMAIGTIDDGNPLTDPDPAWQPLVANPPYPDYISGHACISGSAIGALSAVFGPQTLDVDLESTVPGSGPPRHYDSARQLDTDTMNGRIWLGLHFRKAMTDGNRLGHTVSDRMLQRFSFSRSHGHLEGR